MVEDQREIRECLVLLLNGTDGFRCAGAFRTMEAALGFLATSADLPSVALLDIGLPGMSGIEGVRLVRERHPAIVPVMLTIYEDDEDDVRGALRARWRGIDRDNRGAGLGGPQEAQRQRGRRASARARRSR